MQSAIFTSMDITTDSFGFIFALGDLTWVPFVYSLPAHYLVFKPVELGPLLAAGTLVFNLLGYYIFRNTNGDKNDFKNGRNPGSAFFLSQMPSLILIYCSSELKYITTSTGSKLLTSRWSRWSQSRHPNYRCEFFFSSCS
jgi:delta14-sterol reductase